MILSQINLIKEANDFELHVNYVNVDNGQRTTARHCKQRVVKLMHKWVRVLRSPPAHMTFFPAREGGAAPHDTEAQLTEITLQR